MSAYYNEIDPYAAQWLRNLIAAGHIAPGDVDERSIVDVQPDDLRGYTQCHFFAGIGGWSYALRLAGWGDNRPVWTGSCPCQPYSVGSADRAQGQDDARHLWPAFYRLISQRAPRVVFGEQVPSAVRWGWWDEVAVDLEAVGYACGAVVLAAGAYGAAHERRRLYWVADAQREGRERSEHHGRVQSGSGPEHAIDGDTLAESRAALAGDYSGLLPGDGLPVGVERCATHGYGNAIVPQVAAEFIGAYLDAVTA